MKGAAPKKQSSENIRVCVRVRPLSGKEKEQGCKESVECNPGTASIAVHHAVGEPDRFTFDSIYTNQFTQYSIFMQECQPLCEAVMNGFNATVFAYGQTGSGKTWTMTGAPRTENAGLMPNAIDYLFKALQKSETAHKRFTIRASYLELYNGKARDLLTAKQTSLDIKQNNNKNFYVKGLSEQVVAGTDETLALFDEGTERRQVAETEMNATSSRSHSIFTVNVEIIDSELDPTSPVIMHSKLNLVDLAGSERQSKTGTTGEALKEGCNINLSLSALGTVIDCIVKDVSHVPFRSSPLTMLLKDSLGGNSKTVMFANCGPADKNISETISTLRFADRAKQIKNKPQKNMDPKDAKIEQLVAEIEKLKAKLGGGGSGEDGELEQLKERIETLEGELSMEKSERERIVLELQEEINIGKQTINQLAEVAQQTSQDLQSHEMEKQRLKEGVSIESEQANELKTMLMNFMREVMTQDQMSKVLQAQRSDDVDALLDDADPTTWNVQQTMALLDAAKGAFREMKSGGVSQEQLDKERKKLQGLHDEAVEELKRQSEAEKKALEDANRAKSEELEKLNEEIAKAKVDLDTANKKMDKITTKATKQLQKLEEKVEKEHAELLKLTEQLSDASAALETERKDATNKIAKAIEEVQTRHRAELTEATATLSKDLADKTFDATKLTERIAELEANMTHRQMRKVRMADGTSSPQPSTGTAAGKGTPNAKTLAADGSAGENGLANDGMIMSDDDVDDDAVEQLRAQIKLHVQLQQIQQYQQRQLDSLLAQHRELQGAAGGMASVEVMQSLALKDKEIEEVKANQAKEQERLVKKINKKLAEFKESEARYEEERVALEEEKTELASSLEEVSKINEQLEVELENLKLKLKQAGTDASKQRAADDQELARLRGEIELSQHKLQELRSEVAELREQADEKRNVEIALAKAEAQLKEKIISIENNRNMLKWREELLDQEKKKVEDVKADLVKARAEVKDAEEYWRKEAEKNATQLISTYNRKLEEAKLAHQELMDEEYQKQKQLKAKIVKGKSQVQKAKEELDTQICENANTQKQLEEAKVAAMQHFREKEDLASTLNFMGKGPAVMSSSSGKAPHRIGGLR